MRGTTIVHNWDPGSPDFSKGVLGMRWQKALLSLMLLCALFDLWLLGLNTQHCLGATLVSVLGVGEQVSFCLQSDLKMDNGQILL